MSNSEEIILNGKIINPKKKKNIFLLVFIFFISVVVAEHYYSKPELTKAIVADQGENARYIKVITREKGLVLHAIEQFKSDRSYKEGDKVIVAQERSLFAPNKVLIIPPLKWE